MAHSLNTRTVKGSKNHTDSLVTLELVHDENGHSVEMFVDNGVDRYATFYADEEHLTDLINALQAKKDQLVCRKHNDG